jgi:hypothetical protein
LIFNSKSKSVQLNWHRFQVHNRNWLLFGKLLSDFTVILARIQNPAIVAQTATILVGVKKYI